MQKQVNSTHNEPSAVSDGSFSFSAEYAVLKWCFSDPNGEVKQKLFDNGMPFGYTNTVNVSRIFLERGKSLSQCLYRRRSFLNIENSVRLSIH